MSTDAAAAVGSRLPVSEDRVHETRVDYVLDHLRQGILRGRYAPGQRLIEADLTRELSVSRGPLREALRRLSAEGVIEIVPHRGALVRRLSLPEMIEFFQIRGALEGLAARLAARAVGDAAVRGRFEADIRPIWVQDARVAGPAYIEENKGFHEAIVTASGNQQLLAVTRQLQLPLLMFQLAGMLRPDIIAESVAEHRGIANAILERNPAEAEALMKAHLQRASKVANAMPQEFFRA